MKRLTAFFTIAILVCIATFVVFASNQNRDESYSHLTVLQSTIHEDLTAGDISDQANSGTDSEGPLYSTADAWSGYYLNEDGEIKYGASGYGYVSCNSDNENYKTTYTLYAEVRAGLQHPYFRNPQTLPRMGSFYDSVFRSGEADGMFYTLGGSRGSGSASGKNLTTGAQHNTSAATPTPATARDLEIICDACDDYGCSLCDKYR